MTNLKLFIMFIANKGVTRVKVDISEPKINKKLNIIYVLGLRQWHLSLF